MTSAVNDSELRRSWEANARLWTAAVRSGAIASRRLVTDNAIIEAVAARAPTRVLDLGCGEGWLARVLSRRGIEVVGVDASPALIDVAREIGGGEFHLASYADLESDPARVGGEFDVVVANFALLHEDLAPLLASLKRVLSLDGVFVIQTLHPMSAGAPYCDGWRTERFHDFGESGAWQPMPWYFRTVGSWFDVIRASGYELVTLQEPTHPETVLPLSLLMGARPK